MKSISNPPQKKRSYNCFSGSVCYLLERKGTMLSECMSFGLSGGLDFVIMSNNSLTFRAVRSLHCLTEFIEKLGVRVTENTASGLEETLRLIKSNVDNDLPLMIQYDGYYLPFTQIYNKRHEMRIGLVVGYDVTSVYLSDFIYGVYSVAVDMELFEQARNPKLGACVSPNWYSIAFPEDINCKITPELVASSLTNVSEYFLSGHGNSSSMVGVEGMKFFAYQIESLVSKKKRNVISVDWIKFSEDLKQMTITLNHYGDFISEISRKQLLKLDEKQTQKAAEMFYKVSITWRIVCSLFFKLGLTGKEAVVRRLSENILEASELLEGAFEIVQDELIKHN